MRLTPERRDLATIGRSEEGFRFLLRILDELGTWKPNGSLDPIASARVEAKRAYGLQLFEDIAKANADLAADLLREYYHVPTRVDGDDDDDL